MKKSAVCSWLAASVLCAVFVTSPARADTEALAEKESLPVSTALESAAPPVVHTSAGSVRKAVAKRVIRPAVSVPQRLVSTEIRDIVVRSRYAVLLFLGVGY